MNEILFGPAQRAFISDFKHGHLRRINLLEGSVRSGKTYVSLIVWAMYLARMPKDGRYMMVGHTLLSLKRNCLEPLQQMMGGNMRLTDSGRRAVIFGRSVELEGSSDERAEARIRGVTLNGAYVDELSLAPRSFFAMLLSRLSAPGAKLFATTNPDGPRHWLKTEYLDRPGLSVYRKKFLLEENPALEPAYIESLKREYRGVFYRRFIQGDWAAAQGAVYPMFDPARHVAEHLPEMRFTWIGCDIGHTNPTAFVRLGAGKDGRIYVIDEFYHSAEQSGPMAPSQYARALVRFAGGPTGEWVPQSVVIDPAAEGFILQLREVCDLRLRRADNAVLEGIQLLSAALDLGMIQIFRGCSHLIDEIYGYCWDEKAQRAGEDRPIKQNDHALDALRYALMAYKREIRRAFGEGVAAISG